MAYIVGKAYVGAVDEVHTTQANPVGMHVEDNEGNEYVYMQGVGSVVQYDWVTYDEAHVTTRAVANAIGRVAIAQAAIDATTDFGLFMVRGNSLGTALTGFADNAAVYLTATAGAVDDSDVAGDAVINAWGRGALSGTTAEFEINHPSVHNIAID